MSLLLHTSKSRVVGLDLMRSIAILLVVYTHSKPFLSDKFYIERIVSLDGVSIFFVLSGFLIGSILLKITNNKTFTKKDIFNFWIRRWFRTLPNYFLILIVLIIFQLVIFKHFGQVSISFFFFFQNLLSRPSQFFAESWSLPVEEWFYFLLPLAYYFFLTFFKNNNKVFVVTTIFFLIIPLVLRLIKYHFVLGLQEFDLDFRKVVILRLDSITYGIMGAYIAFNYPKFWHSSRLLLLYCGIAFLITLYFDPSNFRYNYPPLTFNIESITYFCFLPFLSSFKSTKIFYLDAIITFVSVISYSVYLVHYTLTFDLLHITDVILKYFKISLNRLLQLDGFLYLLYTFLGGYLLCRYYEMPMTNLRERYKVK